MMQASYFGKDNNIPMLRSLDRAKLRSVLAQSQVSPALVIVCEVGSEYALQVTLVEHDDMIQAIAPNGANQPLNVGRLPRRARSNSDLFQSQSLGPAPKFPPSGAIGVLLRQHAHTGDEKLLEMATTTS